MAAITKFQQAKVRIGLKHPFFAVLMMMTPVEMDKSIPTARTNMKRIKYNPDFLESLPSVAMVMFVIVHELGHIFLMHGLRMGARNPERWNIACDHAINLMLEAAGFELWPNCHCDRQYRGMSAEQIYDKLAEDEQKQPKGGQQGQPGGQGSGQPGQGRPQPGSGPQIGRDLEPVQVSPAEKTKIEGDIKQAVARAVAVGRMRGKLPGDLERLLGTYFDPPLPWEQILAEYMLRLAHDDENWARRNRRFQQIYLPGRKSTRMGEAIIIGDSSGSMVDDVFAMIAVQINYIRETCRPELTRVIWTDTKVHLEETFEVDDDVVLHPKGGGGSDMREALRYVEQYDPEVVILITDGEVRWPASVPYNLIVLCTTTKACPIGDVVRVPVS